MKKIIAALDGLKFSSTTCDIAISIARNTNAFLTGVFLDDFTYTSYRLHELVAKEGATDKELKLMEEKDISRRNLSTAAFETACRAAGVHYNIHHDKKIAIQELLHESVYADMLVIGNYETFTHYEENAPTHFIRELLPGVHCPVLLVPNQQTPIEKIVLLYDGGMASVHAIKMFMYLLPLFKHLPAEVIAVKGLYDDFHMPDNRLIKEYLKRHLPELVFTVLKGDPSVAITEHLKRENKNTLVVMGAYARGTVSRWIKPSLADILMLETKFPLFIAHDNR